MKIGPVDPQLIGLQEIIKKKLPVTQVERSTRSMHAACTKSVASCKIRYSFDRKADVSI